MNGRLIKTLVNRAQSPGYKTVTWNGKDSKSKTVAAECIHIQSRQALLKYEKMLFIK